MYLNLILLSVKFPIFPKYNGSYYRLYFQYLVGSVESVKVLEYLTTHLKNNSQLKGKLLYSYYICKYF